MNNVSTRALFDNGQPSWQTLWSRPALNKHTTGGGVYAMLYHIEEPDKPREWHWYVGRTINFGKRLESHNSIIISPKEPKTSKNHYLTARRAQKWGGYRMVKVCDLSPHSSKESNHFQARTVRTWQLALWH
jgi:hypothetical protein